MPEDQDSLLLHPPASPALERYRMAQAELAELELAGRKKAAGLELGATPIAVTRGRSIIQHHGTVIPENFPTSPGLYLARHGRGDDLKAPYNAILDVTGTAPYLECVLHSIGRAASEPWEPTHKRLRVGPRLPLRLVTEEEATESRS